jgi:glyoxylase-like metal-dependent hydrolase (beta-lactamase superfamily II)
MLSLSMRRTLSFCAAAFLTAFISFKSQAQKNNYRVYALKFGQRSNKIAINDIALGVKSSDSTEVYYMYWLVKGDGKKILVDAGFRDDADIDPKMISFTRPDKILERINVKPEEITDIIITHPHWDHIGGIDLYPNAMVWMQKDDFEYFTNAAWQKGGDHGGFNEADVKKIIKKKLDGKLTLVKGDSLEILPGIRVFTGSKHTFESQYVAVNGYHNKKIILASDNAKYYYNLDSLLPVPATYDPQGYINNLRRMKAIMPSGNPVVPGHDPLVFKKFSEVAKDVVEIKH